MKTSVLVICCVAAMPSAWADQQQTLSIARPLLPVSGPPLTGRLDEKQAAALITSVLGTADPAADRAYMIHAVQYQEDKFAAESQNWYVYDAGEINCSLSNLRPGGHFTDARIFGRHKLGLVYLHIFRAVSVKDAGKLLRSRTEFLVPAPTSLKDEDLTEQIDADSRAIEALDPGNAAAAAAKARSGGVRRPGAEHARSARLSNS